MLVRGASAALALLLAWPAAIAAQQTGVVRGQAVDAATGAPLGSVQIRVEGTTIGAMVGADGRYVLTSVPAGTQTISARRLGYAADRQTVTVTAGGEAVANFRLRAAAITLDEVVVTGVAAAATRREVANTVESISGEAVQQAPGVTSIDQALQGRITGAVISENSGQPGGGVSVRLRGTNSILGGAEPLYVIDGVIVDNSSGALVGLGANATYSGAGLSNRLADLDPNDVERIEVLKGAAAAALYGSRANNGVIQIFTRRGQSGRSRISFSTEYQAGETPKRYDLLMIPTATRADSMTFHTATSPMRVGDEIERYDVQDQIFRTAHSTTNRLSVSGGGDNTTFYVGGSWQREQGIIQESDYDRRSLRANIDHSLRANIDIGVRANFIQSRANYVPEGEQTQGVLTTVIFTPTSFNYAFDTIAGRYPYAPFTVNSLTVLNQFEAPEEVTRFVGGFDATFRPFPSVTLRYLAGVDDYRREARYYRPPRSETANFLGEIQNPVQFSRLFNNDVTGTHVWVPSAAFGLTSGVGFRYTQDETESVRAAASNLPPGQQLVGGAVLSASQGLTQLRTVGAYIEERLSIADQLYITGGLNWDASSAFGESERLQMFPRVGVSWVADESPFLAGAASGLFSSLRLRAAWGETGGQPPSAYSRFENYVGSSFSGLPGLVASTVAGNPNLRPERQREVEAGFELGTFGGKAELEFTYYDKKTKDLVLSVPLALSRGFSTQFQNIGTLENRGIELALNTVNVSGPSLTWRSRLTYAANRNEVTRLTTSADTLITGYLNAVIEGHPVGVFVGGYYRRDAQGNRIHADTTIGATTFRNMARRAEVTLPDGRLVADRRVIGDPNPDFVMSFLNTFDLPWRMQASVMLDGRFGNDVANFTRRISEFFGADARLAEEVRGDTAIGTYSRNPIGRIQIYEEYIEDGSFVKLREVALSVGISPAFAARLGAEGMSLRLAGRNLYTWTDYTGLDPEVNLFSANTVARGVDFATTPIPRTFSISLMFNY